MNKIICLLLATTCFIPLLSASRNSRDNDRDEDFIYSFTIQGHVPAAQHQGYATCKILLKNDM